MTKTLLTVIIPFLNEGEEVRRTLASLRGSTTSQYNVILINDASDDGHDYSSIAEEFGALYIVHERRKGVAASRDEGVRLSQTPYVLFLDAHMRVYQSNWVERILEVALSNPRSLICGSTLALNKDGEVEDSQKVGYGAYIHYSNLLVKWVSNQNLIGGNNDIMEIPCVLGASYICNRDFWLEVGGLEGLSTYGLDEQLISLKVRLFGGKCLCVKDIVFGHIFRTLETVPYKFNSPDFVKNILFIGELFFSKSMKIELVRTCKTENTAETWEHGLASLNELSSFVTNLKEMYKSKCVLSIEDIVAQDECFVKDNIRQE